MNTNFQPQFDEPDLMPTVCVAMISQYLERNMKKVYIIAKTHTKLVKWYLPVQSIWLINNKTH